ncbi:MAG: RHS repeat-associated core domain-containing protein [Thermoanaerobaculales bacterium]|jgi:RHS repeat-associated protein|nr:RHS repeat-associated core domain-containing protein [Thermoanaerobaculales bacterium]
MVDLVLPGNGGLDIVVQRYYNSQVWNRVDDPELARHTPSVDLNGHLGESGWQLHMGKLINFFAEADQEMTLILPDGSTHTLYSRDGDPDQRITSEGWLYSRSNSVFTVHTTTGLKYIFDRDEPGADSSYLAMRDPQNRMYMLQCTRIEDLNGNAIVIEYSDFHYPGLGYGWGNRIDRISFDDNSDNREVVFTYHDDASGTPTNIIEHMHLKNDDTEIETWTFNYVGSYQVDHPQFPYILFVTVNELGYVNHSITGDYATEEVTNPWQFTYHDDSTQLTQGKRLIKDVISPRIGKITYTWNAEVMETGGQSCGGVKFLTVDTRTVAVGIGQEPGGAIIYEDETATDYTYTNPGLEDGSTSIVTTDSQTGAVLSTEDFVFHGWSLPYIPYDWNMWKIGRPKSSTVVIKDDAGNDLETTTTTTVWEQGSQFSDESRWSSLWFGCGSSREFGPQSYVKPTSVTRVVERHDSNPDPPPTPLPDPDWYSTVSSAFDDYGNVGHVYESSFDGLERTTQLTYWAEPTNNIMVGRVKGQDADPGGMQCYQYDTLGRVEHSYINPQSDDVADCTVTGTIIGARQTDFSYDGDGNLYTQTELNTNDRVTTHTNYVYGKPTETVITTGTRSNVHYCRDYEPRGMVAWETDGRGCSTSYQTVYGYDFSGRRTSADPPLSDPINYWYPLRDSTQALVMRGDRVMDYRFDRIGSGNLTAIYKHVGASLKTTQLFAVTNDALGRRRLIQQLWDTRLGDVFSYDPLGRLTTITHPDATQVTIDYAGSAVTVTDENNHITDYVYRAFGNPNDRRLASLTDAGKFTTTYGYDTVFGNLDSIDAPLAHGDRSFRYHSDSTACDNGFLSGETHPESGTTSYKYNCLGDITTRTREGKEITTYDYDSAGRLTNINYSDSSSDVDLTYDQASRRTSVMNDNASTVFTYDNAGRLSTVTQSIVGGPQCQETSYLYDSLDRLDTMTYPSSRVVRYGWNDDNWLTSVTGADGYDVEYLTDVTHHDTGAIDLVTFGNTVTTDHGIDARNRLSTMLTTAPGGQLLNATLGYDDASNITTWNDNLAANEDRAFGYDSLDRLTSASAPNLWGSLSFVYDALGNRRRKTHHGLTTKYCYDSSTNRLTGLSDAEQSTYAYDNVGRLIQDQRTLDEAIFIDGFESGDTSAWNGFALKNVPMVTIDWDYTFNEADQLVQVSRDSSVVGTYVYDGDNLRVSNTLGETTTYYLRNADGNTLAEYNQNLDLIAEYVYANGRQVAKVVPDGVGGNRFRFFHADHLGSSLSITDGVGAIVWTGTYYPFGEPFSSRGEADRYRFTQHELDAQSGFLYAKARFYHPGIGRFLSTDPVDGNVNASQSWNRYAYALNNPVMYTDPTGKAPFGALTEQAIRSEMTSGQVEQFNQIQNEVDAVAAGPMLLFTPGPDELLVAAALKPIGRFAGRLVSRLFSKADDASDLKSVVVSGHRHPETAAHISDAQIAGQPSTLTIDRPGAPGRRSQSQAGHDRVPGKDLDEYPPAMFKEGGKGASIRPVSPADNRGAGACIGNQCRGLSDGTQVKIVVE